MAVMLVSSLASAQAKGISYDDFASNRWSGGWEAVYESSQNVGSGLAQVTATADPDRREPGLVTSYSFYPTHETVYVCWEVLTPLAVIAGAQWSLVSPCDGAGSAEAAPWQVWLEHPAERQWTWKVRVGDKEQEVLRTTDPYPGPPKSCTVQLELKAGNLSIVIDDQPAGSYVHGDYAGNPRFKFGSGYRGEAPAEVTSQFNWVEVGGRPLPKPRWDTIPSADLAGTDYLSYQMSRAQHHSHGDIVELADGRLLFVWTDYSGQGDIV